MSVVILTDRVQRLECLYCTTTDHAFGPVMELGEAEAFLDWLKEAGAEYGRIEQPALIGDGSDPRDYALDHLEEIYHQFRRERDARLRLDALTPQIGEMFVEARMALAKMVDATQRSDARYHEAARELGAECEQEGAEPDNLRYLGDGRWGATSR